MLLEVVEVGEEVGKMGIRIEWFDRVIGKVLEVKEYVERTATIRERMEVLQKQLDVFAEERKEVESEMARYGLDPSGLVNQVVVFFKVAHRFFSLYGNEMTRGLLFGVTLMNILLVSAFNTSICAFLFLEIYIKARALT